MQEQVISPSKLTVIALNIALVAYWLVMFTATHVPKIPTALEPGFSDKWQHYVAYALLGILLAARVCLGRGLSWSRLAIVFGITAAYGAFDEITQPLFGRDAELLDWRSDVIGALTGIAMYVAGHWWLARRNATVPSPPGRGLG